MLRLNIDYRSWSRRNTSKPPSKLRREYPEAETSVTSVVLKAPPDMHSSCIARESRLTHMFYTLGTSTYTFLHPACMHECTHGCRHTYIQIDSRPASQADMHIQTYIHKHRYVQPGRRTDRRTNIHKTQTHIHACMHAHMHAYIHTDPRAYLQTYTHTYARTHLPTYLHTNIHAHAHTHPCMHAYILTYTLYRHICVYMYNMCVLCVCVRAS